MNITKTVLTAVYVAFVAATLFAVGNVGQYFDAAAFIFVGVVAGFCVTVGGVKARCPSSAAGRFGLAGLGPLSGSSPSLAAPVSLRVIYPRLALRLRCVP